MRAKSFTKAVKGISFITAGVFSLLTLSANAQLLTNRGAMIYINTDTVLYVDGDVWNATGTIVNLGRFEITGDMVNDAQLGGTGSVTFPNNGLPQCNGVFRVGGDWVNNNLFYAGTGTVKLIGAIQGIAGIATNNFYNLELQGTGRKEIQTMDQYVHNKLILNSQELWTDQYTMLVENTNADAIQRDAGFVSSLESGSLSRRTASMTDYLFPVGSTQGFPRYRPAKIRPTTAFPNRFTVRLVNADPTTDDPNDVNDYTKPVNQHDLDICYVNDNYWYKINHPEGSDNADISLSYDEAVPEDQGFYNGIVQWDNFTDNRWENIGTTASVTPSFNSADSNTTSDPQTLMYVRKNAHGSFTPEPFTLAYKVPPAPPIFGNPELCADVSTTYTITPNLNGTYVFTVDSGVVVSTTDTSVTVIWNDLDSGFVNVIETIDNNNGYPSCPSLVGTFPVNILSLPHAIFTPEYEYPNPNTGGPYNYNNPDAVFIDDLITFHDSSTNTSSWYWDFDDQIQSWIQNPYHTYGDTGTYNVMLVATSPDGCLDTAYAPIMVVEGLIISNVFTPNGDGFNDVFKVRNSNVTEFTIRIFNRWGTQIFETTAPEISWDGKTSAGFPAPAGTYFYTLNAKLASGADIATYQDAETLDKGTITLIR